jgi:hypothetical protein
MINSYGCPTYELSLVDFKLAKGQAELYEPALHEISFPGVILTAPP